MLVLSRRVGERIMVGDDIVIEVAEVRGNRVRLAIGAPDYITIAREELLGALLEDEQRKARPPAAVLPLAG